MDLVLHFTLELEKRGFRHNNSSGLIFFDDKLLSQLSFPTIMATTTSKKREKSLSAKSKFIQEN
jgi:hypothetical protein